MPSRGKADARRDDEYDSFDDGDEDDLMPGLRAKSPQGRQLVQVQVDNCEPTSLLYGVDGA